MKNLVQMFKQAQQMQERVAEMQVELQNLEITGRSGGGLVEVTLSGKGDMRRLKIAPGLFEEKDVGMIEDLVIAAYNDTKAKVDAYSTEAMQRVAGGITLPAGLKLF
ncbi:MAG: YbaB/EbfC family nucleoid-associated protein [Alphaproteobacteria bacterium]|nr:YbaB/EbfC family nucleoid-associated protein [Alphaproteobacteria bacterium]